MERKQVSLVIPKPMGIDSPRMYQGIWYVGSHLVQKGFDVKIYDEQLGQASKNIIEIIEKSFIVGFTAMTVQLRSAVDLSRMVKKAGIPVIWGGIHPTLFPSQCMKENYVDYVAYDEGEATMAELCDVLVKNKKGCLQDIKGIYYKDKGNIFRNAPRPYLDLNTLSPDYDIVNIERYAVPQFVLGKFRQELAIETGRGCFFRCSFCINTLLNKRQWRGRSAENLVNEIKRLLKKYKIDHLFFIDENFFTDKKRVQIFCELYRQEKFMFTWSTTCRVNYLRPRYIDDTLLNSLRDCNCIELQMGIESGSQRVLDEIIYKDIKKEDVLIAAKRLKQFNIQPTCSFMIGLPHETKEEQIETLELIKELWRINDCCHILGPQVYRPYPGAKMYEMAQELGFKAPNSINDWIIFLNEEGFINLDNYPWIKNPSMLKNISKYLRYSRLKRRRIIGKVFKQLFLLRVKHNFYKLGIDLAILEMMQRANLILSKTMGKQ